MQSQIDQVRTKPSQSNWSPSLTVCTTSATLIPWSHYSDFTKNLQRDSKRLQRRKFRVDTLYSPINKFNSTKSTEVLRRSSQCLWKSRVIKTMWISVWGRRRTFSPTGNTTRPLKAFKIKYLPGDSTPSMVIPANSHHPKATKRMHFHLLPMTRKLRKTKKMVLKIMRLVEPPYTRRKINQCL